MKGRNDNAFIVQEVVIRDPVTLRTYHVEIEYATLYTSKVTLRFVSENFPVIHIGIRDGEVEVTQ